MTDSVVTCFERNGHILGWRNDPLTDDRAEHFCRNACPVSDVTRLDCEKCPDEFMAVKATGCLPRRG